MATFLEEWEEEHKLFKDSSEDHVDFDKVNKKLKEFRKIEKPTKKDFNEMFTWINKFEQQVPIKNIPITGPLFGKTRAELRDKFNEAYPDREKGYNYESFIEAYKEEDEAKRDKILGGKIYKDGRWVDRGKGLRTEFSPSVKTPHLESGRPFQEADVTEAIRKGALKRPPDPYEGPFGKLGEYFSKNAAARDKLFQYIGSMGKELVKPIQPGQEAAGALVPTLARGMERGEADYAAKQAAQAKHMLDIASAQQKINPLQYYTNAMKEAIAQMPEDHDPNTAAGKSWIANYLRQKGIPKAAVDISSAIESFDMKMQMTSDEEEKKRIQALIDEQYRLLEDMLSGSIGGSSVTNIPYMPS